MKPQEDFVVTDQDGKELFVGKPPVKYFWAKRDADGNITERCDLSKRPLAWEPTPPKDGQ